MESNVKVVGAELNEPDYNFNELTAKITHNFSRTNKLSFDFYLSNDKFYINQFREFADEGVDADEKKFTNETKDIRWGNLMVSGTWRKNFSSNLRSEVSFAYLGYGSQMSLISSQGVNKYKANQMGFVTKQRTETGSESDNRITDYILQWNLGYKFRQNHFVEFGANATYHYFHHFYLRNWSKEESSTDDKPRPKAEQVDSEAESKTPEIHIYGNDDINITDKLLLSPGINISCFQGSERFHWTVSPRLSFNYRASNSIAFKGGYSRTSQYIHQLALGIISLPSDVWLPISGNQLPLTADKFAIGVYKSLTPSIMVSGEVYYKKMHNLIDFKDDISSIPQGVPMNQKTTIGSGTAKGMDVCLQKESGDVTGHISYSLLWTDRKFLEKNLGMTFPARNDNRHRFNIFVNYDISKVFSVSGAWLVMTNNLITLSTQVDQSCPSSRPIGFVRVPTNNYRLPLFHRLDLNAMVRTRIGDFNLSVYNAYDKRNAVGITTDVKWENQEKKIIHKKLTIFSIFPSLSYTFRF